VTIATLTTPPASATLITSEVVAFFAAEGFAISPQTIRRWADEGLLPGIRLTPSSPRRYRREDVEALLERARRTAP